MMSPWFSFKPTRRLSLWCVAKIIFDTLEEIPTELQSKAEKTQDGKFQLDAEALTAKNKELKSEVDKARELRDKLKTFEGLDPEAAKTAIAKLATAQEQEEKLKQQLEQQRATISAELNTNFEKALEKERQKAKNHEDRAAKLLAQRDEEMTRAALTAAIAAKDGNPLFLLPHARAGIKVVEDEKTGVVSVKVVGPDGQPRIGDPKTNADMTVEQFIDEMKADKRWAAAFNASAARGSGADTRNGGGNGNAGSGGGKFVMTSQQVSENFPAYKAMSEEAAKVGQTVQISDQA
jgi:hypothetical protein